MKLPTFLFLSFTLLSTCTAMGSEFLSLFEPYFGKKISVNCGDDEEQAYSARPDVAILEFTDSGAYGTPYITLRPNAYGMIYLKALDSAYIRLYQSYGGDIGGTTEIVTNEINDSVFRQTCKEKDGLIFKTTSSESEETIDFTNTKEWVYREQRVDYNDGDRSERVCILRPISR